MLAKFGGNGDKMLASSVASSLPLVRAYGATRKNGYSVLLFNLDKSKPASVTVTIDHASGSSYSGEQTVYDKRRYDASKNNVWLGPVDTKLGTLSTTFNVTLSPWSITVVDLN